jgi:multidrug transporter EmrE-like cation transporter
MDSFMSHRFTDWLFLVAAIVASMVIFSSLEKVARSLFVPFVVIAIGLIVAKVFFGLTPQHLWHESIYLIRRLGSSFF